MCLPFSEQPDHKEESVEKFLSDLADNNPQLRGPFLGLMELSKHGTENGAGMTIFSISFCVCKHLSRIQ